MKIWYIHNYTMLPEHGALNRGYYLGKYLERNGQEPTVFVGSHPHNTKYQLIEGKQKYTVYQNKPFPWVLIKTLNYESSKIKRVLSMFEFYHNMKYAAKQFEKPDAIIGSSAHPLVALLALKLGKKYGCKKIIEVRDLWPESIVVYGLAKRTNLIIKLLYKFEKYLYMNADSIIFTMEAGYDYIKQSGWEKDIPEDKVFYLNNGVDLEQFIQNRDCNRLEDLDLENSDYFNVVYTGSIRKVNNLSTLIDVAKIIKDKKIRILVYGAGNELENLNDRVKAEKLDNIIFKGFIEKKYIPYVVSKADLNIIHGGSDDTAKYGTSQNKMFDYFASGKPILRDTKAKNNPILVYGAGIETLNSKPESIAKSIIDFYEMDKEKYTVFCRHALEAAKVYDYRNLANKLVWIIENTSSNY